MQISSLTDLNNYLVSESFFLPPKSQFTFSAIAGITDSAMAGNLFQGGWIRFKVQVIDASTGTV
jgi:hypothetical protein